MIVLWKNLPQATTVSWHEEQWSQVQIWYKTFNLYIANISIYFYCNFLLPDPSKDTFITLDGKQVAVPQGPPVDQPQYKDSHFSNSEYLVYKESQCRMRYLLELQMK